MRSAVGLDYTLISVAGVSYRMWTEGDSTGFCIRKGDIDSNDLKRRSSGCFY